MKTKPAPFWKTKTFYEMTPEEWESLCDACARCCLYKIEDEDSGDIIYTNVVCRYLDLDNCRCTVYAQRTYHIPTCVKLTPDNIPDLFWMPESCAYQLISKGKDLKWWHPLISGDPKTVKFADITICGKAISETEDNIRELENYGIDWVD